MSMFELLWLLFDFCLWLVWLISMVLAPNFFWCCCGDAARCYVVVSWVTEWYVTKDAKIRGSRYLSCDWIECTQKEHGYSDFFCTTEEKTVTSVRRHNSRRWKHDIRKEIFICSRLNFTCERNVARHEIIIVIKVLSWIKPEDTEPQKVND